MPTVSVAVCTHQGARYLAEQMESILAGTRLPDEIIVVDDASTDGTLEIAERLLRDVPRARILRNTRPLGVAKNFERAVLECSGDIVMLSDQDDRWHPDRLERALDALTDDAILLVHADADLIDDESRSLGATLFSWLRLDRREIAMERVDPLSVLVRRNTVTGATAAFRRTLVSCAAPFPEGWLHDEWLALVASVSGGMEVLPALIDYRIHDANQVGAARPTLARRIRRAVRRDEHRNALLTRKWEVARDRLESSVPAPVARKLQEKAAFEAQRASLPRARLLRVPTVVVLLARRQYTKFASQGRLDVVRDLFQPR